ncbi:hypothetical protein KQI30_07440 [Clostridium bornimense]|uniref:hypothetical protein n=1 Tax=Clostridium bornimense TaxID=1216932 RepID=UPI001C1032B0|nr:hypothetical protein [Clostridium bornimense]MBU5316102.1 hypothetical protein [Clostridium bornimense]
MKSKKGFIMLILVLILIISISIVIPQSYGYFNDNKSDQIDGLTIDYQVEEQ